MFGFGFVNLQNFQKLFGLPLHSFEANWSILKFAIGNRKLLTLTFSFAFLNRRDQISLLHISVHVKGL